jgi:hypothetical protein
MHLAILPLLANEFPVGLNAFILLCPAALCILLALGFYRAGKHMAQRICGLTSIFFSIGMLVASAGTIKYDGPMFVILGVVVTVLGAVCVWAGPEF